jgi:hypothetical protein
MKKEGFGNLLHIRVHLHLIIDSRYHVHFKVILTIKKSCNFLKIYSKMDARKNDIVSFESLEKLKYMNIEKTKVWIREFNFSRQ